MNTKFTKPNTHNFLEFYNSLRLKQQALLNTKVHEQMKTLRYRVFAIGGYIIQKGNQRILKLFLAMKRREWITGLLTNTNILKSKFIFDSGKNPEFTIWI